MVSVYTSVLLLRKPLAADNLRVKVIPGGSRPPPGSVSCSSIQDRCPGVALHCLVSHLNSFWNAKPSFRKCSKKTNFCTVGSIKFESLFVFPFWDVATFFSNMHLWHGAAELSIWVVLMRNVAKSFSTNAVTWWGFHSPHPQCCLLIPQMQHHLKQIWTDFPTVFFPRIFVPTKKWLFFPSHGGYICFISFHVGYRRIETQQPADGTDLWGYFPTMVPNRRLSHSWIINRRPVIKQESVTDDAVVM